MPLVDGDIRIGVAIGVGIGDVDPAEWLASDYTWALGSGPVDGLEQRVVLVGIPVRPAIDGDGLEYREPDRTLRQKAFSLVDREHCVRKFRTTC